MSKAEKMFNELDWGRYETKNDDDIAYGHNYYRNQEYIYFDNKRKQVDMDLGRKINYTIELHQAITEQMKELGWLK